MIELKKEFEKYMINYANNIWTEDCDYCLDKGEKQLNIIWNWINEKFISYKEWEEEQLKVYRLVNMSIKMIETRIHKFEDVNPNDINELKEEIKKLLKYYSEKQL